MSPRRGLRSLLAGAAALAALLLAGCAGAPEPPEPYAVGERLAPLVLEDAHGRERRVDAEVRTVLFTRDMDADEIVDRALSEAPEGLLAARDAVYVADISGMPDVIARLFALPSLRERAYPMLLDRSGEATARIPADEGRVTLLRLEGGRVASVARLDSTAGVREALEAGGRTGGAEGPTGYP